MPHRRPRQQGRPRSQRIRTLEAIDGIVFSSLWAAAVAAALISAVAAAFDIALPIPAVALSFLGTFVVYNIDRLRDVERDRATTPSRTAFIERNHARLLVCAGVAALASLGAAAVLPPRVAALCAGVLAVGLLHRRIKHVTGLKTAYITFAWTAVCVGIPAQIGDLSFRESLPTGIAIGMTLAANLIVSNLRDQEGGISRVPGSAAMGLALLLCLLAAVACLSETAGLERALAAVPILEAVAIAGFATPSARHDRERYGLAVVDGALLLGGLAVLGLL